MLFADIKLFHIMFRSLTIYQVIPVYTTEIIITIALAYVLFSVGKMERNSTTLNHKRH